MLTNCELSEQTGKCVFMLVPMQADLFVSPGANLISQRKAVGESTWQVTLQEPRSLIVRTPGLQPEMFVEFSGPGSGLWGLGSGADRSVVGRAVLPQSD
jgi:hypothetical protein